MATKKTKRKALKSSLSKEVHLPIRLPESKIGKTLGKQRRLPLAKYFSESYAEMKKVTWPSRKETLKLTFAVIVFTTIFTLFMTIADLGIGNVVERVLL